MKELKWIKLSVSVFENRKIKYLSRMEGGEFYELIWIKLLCLAGQINDGGRIYLVKRRMITPEEIADIIGMPEDAVCEAILLFDELDMIIYNGDVGFVIKNYCEFQRGAEERGDDAEVQACGEDNSCERVSIADMTDEQRKEYNREAKKRSREGKKCENTVSKECQNDVKTDFDMSKECQNDVKKVFDTSKKCQNDVKNSPKNIFIEENREEENRIDENRLDEIRIEERGGDDCGGSQRYAPAARDIPRECDDAISSQEADAIYHQKADEICSQERTSEEMKENCAVAPSSENCANAPTHPEKKNRYGIFNNVLLSDKEYSELSLKCPDIADELIEDFSSHIEATGKEYRNHYAVLLRWSKNEFAPGRARVVSPQAKAICSLRERDISSRGDDAIYQPGADEICSQKRTLKKRRYGDFDPMEAFRLALRRSGCA